MKDTAAMGAGERTARDRLLELKIDDLTSGLGDFTLTGLTSKTNSAPEGSPAKPKRGLSRQNCIFSRQNSAPTSVPEEETPGCQSSELPPESERPRRLKRESLEHENELL